MPFSLSKFIAKRLGTSSSKYNTTVGDDCGRGVSSPPEVLVVLGGSLCAITHQSDVCRMVSELIDAVYVFVGHASTDGLADAIDEAISDEARYLMASPSNAEDTRSIATVRRGAPSPAAPVDAEQDDAIRQNKLLLYFPLLNGAQFEEIVIQVQGLPSVSGGFNVRGAVVFEGTSLHHEDVSHAQYRQRWLHQTAASTKVLRLPMGCTVCDSYELFRIAVEVLKLTANSQGGHSVLIDMTNVGKPPKPGSAAADGDVELDTSNAGGSASRGRLRKCRTIAIQTLRTIAFNLVQSKGTEERYRVLLANTSRFNEVLGSSPNAMCVLSTIGFHEVDGSGRRMPVERQRTGAWGHDMTRRLMLSADAAASALPELRRLVADLDVELSRRAAVAAVR